MKVTYLLPTRRTGFMFTNVAGLLHYTSAKQFFFGIRNCQESRESGRRAETEVTCKKET